MSSPVRRLVPIHPGEIDAGRLSTIDTTLDALSSALPRVHADYVAVLERGVLPDPRWLSQLVAVLAADRELGGAGATLVGRDGRILASGLVLSPDLRWRSVQDAGGGPPGVREVDALPFSAALFRRRCLQEVGELDPDFAGGEELDFGQRCRAAGWKLAYVPDTAARATAGDGDAGPVEASHERNRLLFAAKHFPRRLADAIRTSRLSPPELFGCLASVLAKLLRGAPRSAGPVVEEVCELLAGKGQVRALDEVLKRLQVGLGHRRPSIGIYDHALHVVGGGQKYMAMIAAVLQDDFEVTFLAHEPVDLSQLGAWYGLDLSRCRFRLIPMPFYRGRSWIDSALVTSDVENPFDAVARASADYDVFVNANMLEKVRPLAPLSVFFCHFPDVLPRAYFAAHAYTVLVASSEYGRNWVRRRWGLEPSMVLYPAIDVRGPQLPKERIILSVARFEPGGSKKQLEMIDAFTALRAHAPDRFGTWRLVLVGGSLPDNGYLDGVRRAASRGSDSIEVRANVSFDELRDWYGRSAIFWHACGIGERDPQLIEHFGMTTVEAMQNGCAPVVFDGGGQREIVEHGTSGFRFGSLEELCAWTMRLVEDDALRGRVQAAARTRSARFGRAAFETRARSLFQLLRREYSTLGAPDRGEGGRRFRVDSQPHRDR